ncbi:MAG: hypothetical protein Q9164_000510 [Protoblastenia rupestris]
MDSEKHAQSDGSVTTTPENESLTHPDPSQADIEKAPPVLGEEQPRALIGVKWFLFVASTLTSIFLYALDNTIVANIVPAMVNQFDSIDQLPWLSVG